MSQNLKSQLTSSLPAWWAPVGAALLVVAAATPAWAASKSTAASAERPAAAKPEVTPLIAVVSIGDQRVTIWQGDKAIARSSVSTGMEGHRTPQGVFSVIGKERYHESNLYSNAPMPFMQRITWSGVAMHAGVVPGYPASHGCIRLPEGFAQRLYGMTHMGMRVIVSAHDLSPVAVADAALPSPTFVRASQYQNHQPLLAATSQPSEAGAASALVPVALTNRMNLGGPADADNRLLNPMQRGRLERAQAKAAALEARSDAQALLELAATRSDDARAASDAARQSDQAMTTLQLGLEKARQLTADVNASAEARARAEVARVTLEAAVSRAQYRNELLRRDVATMDAAAFQAAAVAKAALAEQDQLEHAARVAEHATEPISIFVSRREHRVFVRQGFEPVFDADIGIDTPEAPIGTHVFTAVGAPTEGGAMQWVTTTIPGVPSRDEAKARRAKGSKSSVTPASTAAPLPPTASNALSRVKFSDDVMQKISAKLWTGASLIISDYGISGETGKGTDFVVLTR